MDIQEIYRTYGVHFKTEGDRHTRHGWVNTACPFCTGSPGLHLGFDVEKAFFNCWRCGFHTGVDALVALCHITERQARDLYWQLRSDTPYVPRARSTSHLINLTRYRRPSDVYKLRKSHKVYLDSRGFDPDRLEAEWHLASTGPVSYLNDGDRRIDYRNRLFIPILWQEREVSFQCRDVTGRADIKYKTCPAAREGIPMKTIIYRQSEATSRVGIAVEGVTDAWRLGPQAFAVFGIKYTLDQVNTIRKLFDRVVVMFDGEATAQQQARKLVAQLRAVGVDSSVYKLVKDMDPGSLHQDDAAHLVRELIG